MNSKEDLSPHEKVLYKPIKQLCWISSTKGHIIRISVLKAFNKMISMCFQINSKQKIIKKPKHCNFVKIWFLGYWNEKKSEILSFWKIEKKHL